MNKYTMRISGIPHESTQTDYAQTESHSDDGNSCVRKTKRYTFAWENMQKDELDLTVTGYVETGNPKFINLADLFMAIEVELGTMYQLPWSMVDISFPWIPLTLFQAKVKVYRRKMDR